jgi:general secretion pathway protein G
LLVITLQSYRSHRDTARARQAAEEIAAMSASFELRWQDEHCYPDRLDTSTLGQRIDPWGRPYAYYNVAANGVGGARKDLLQNPLNTDFDLYSLGPNGRTSEDPSHRDSRDDVLRARDGGHIGGAKALPPR